MDVLRNKALLAHRSTSFSANATGGGDGVASPGDLVDRKSQDVTCKFELTEDQQAEVSMLMGARTADLHLLQRCRRNTEVSASPG